MPTTKENWKKISDFPKYEISDLGNARNAATKQLLSQRESNNGYMRFNVRSGNRTYENPITIMTHKTVCKEFVANPFNKPYVNHIDGDKHNNKAINLEWCTAKENTEHSYKTGLQKPLYGQDNKRSKPIEQLKDGTVINVFWGTREASRQTGIHYRDIMNNCKGKQATCKGFIFRYRLGVVLP